VGTVAALLSGLALLAVPSAVADTPLLSGAPSDMTVEATGSSGEVVTWTDPTATSSEPPVTVSCSPASGSTFSLGTTQVTCTATDAQNDTNSVSFNVTVQDTTPPSVSVPSPGPVEATGPSGAVVTFGAATASDIVDGSVTPTCSANSGDTFPVGTTTVNCSATDAHGNTGSNSFGVTVQDTTPPTVTPPSAPPPAEATSPAGAVVTFGAASASDLVDGSISASCSPSSGSTFPLGTTAVTCSATDAHGNTGSAAPFSVTVQDTTKPIVSVPAPITTEATGPAGAAVSFSASANDNLDGSISASCSPSSGSTFGFGSTTVNCTATDSHGNTSNPASFTVTVQDTTAPTVTVPSPISGVEATGPGGAAVSFSASASDIVDGSISPSCSPSSGSTFAIGTTAVTCSATDAHGNKGTASFNVTVVDTTKPVLSLVPADIVVEADSSKGSKVTYTAPTAVDTVDGALLVSCSPASTTTFPLGKTAVTCSATDAHSNTGTASFNVTVQDTTRPALNVPVAAKFSSGGANQLARSDPQVTAWLAAASAHDTVDGSVPVTNNAPAVLPLGDTVVTFTATDAAGNIATRQSRITVVTGAAPPANLDTTPPGEVRGLKVKAGDGFVDLTWGLPLDKDFDHVTVSRSTGNNPGSETVVYSGVAKHLKNTRLKNSVEYRYVFVTLDKVGNRSLGVAARATPKRAALYAPADGTVVTKPPVLRWARISGASYYNLQLYRLGSTVQASTVQPGQKVLSAWPKKPDYTLTKKWKYAGRKRQLTPGRYIWYVWPGFGARAAQRYGAVLGQSTFVVKKKR
jgi:hypothetical protein